MALPCILGEIILGTHYVHGKNSHDFGLHFTIAPEIPDCYDEFGPLRLLTALEAREGFIMATIKDCRDGHNNKFDLLAGSFLQEKGLPFSQVLSADSIRQVFQDEDALFGQDDIFSTEIVLWAFLAQTLREIRFDANELGHHEAFTVITTPA